MTSCYQTVESLRYCVSEGRRATKESLCVRGCESVSDLRGHGGRRVLGLSEVSSVRVFMKNV